MARTWTREHAINLQTRRKAQRWTLDQLATRASLDVEVVRQLERAEEMDLDDEEVLRQLALALGVLPKQLCNSPLRSGRKATELTASNAAPAPVTTPASIDPAINRRPATWAVATVAALIIAAAFLPRACARMTVPDVPQAAVAPKAVVPVEPVAEKQDVGAAEMQATSTEEEKLAAITALIADLESATAADAPKHLTTSSEQPMDVVAEALDQQATAPASPVAERLVMILVLEADAPMLRESLAAFLTAAVDANQGVLPWPAPAVESAIAMGAAEDATGVAPAIEAYLDDADQSTANREALKAAIGRSEAGLPERPASDTPKNDLLSETEAVAAPLARHQTDLLTEGPAKDTQSHATEPSPAMDPVAQFAQAIAQPPIDAAAVATALEHAQAAAESGYVVEVRSQLAQWLKEVPADWITISGTRADLWRMLGWALFPGDAPVWEQAFGVDEERWLILVVAKLLDGAEG